MTGTEDRARGGVSASAPQDRRDRRDRAVRLAVRLAALIALAFLAWAGGWVDRAFSGGRAEAAAERTAPPDRGAASRGDAPDTRRDAGGVPGR